MHTSVVVCLIHHKLTYILYFLYLNYLSKVFIVTDEDA
jgi:hypothetical protein